MTVLVSLIASLAFGTAFLLLAGVSLLSVCLAAAGGWLVGAVFLECFERPDRGGQQ